MLCYIRFLQEVNITVSNSRRSIRVINYKKYSCPYGQVIKHYDMKAYWGVAVYVILMTFAVVGADWSVSRPGLFTPEKRHTPVLIGLETRWAPEPVLTGWGRENS
jgi:hypothetical protein